MFKRNAFQRADAAGGLTSKRPFLIHIFTHIASVIVPAFNEDRTSVHR